MTGMVMIFAAFCYFIVDDELLNTPLNHHSSPLSIAQFRLALFYPPLPLFVQLR